jgi:uncharacterized protein
MKPGKFSRRQFLRIGFYGGTGGALANSFWWEPDWIKVRTVRLTAGPPAHRFVQFTDTHFKGDTKYLQTVVERINALSPDFVCFTGDLVEQAEHVRGALKVLSGIKCPLYGVPGNHDHWCHADFEEIAETFAATGGAWLMDHQIRIRNGSITLAGASCEGREPPRFSALRGSKNILLTHFPIWADKMRGEKFDLILAGHSHGGQIRLPFYGALMLPYNVGKYDLGLFQTDAGPLYVNPGVGWLLVKARLLCRPELTVFEM